MDLSIVLRLENERYFRNPFFENVADGARRVDHEWLLQRITDLTQRIASRNVPADAYEKSGPYVGPSGISYSLIRTIHKIGPSQNNLIDYSRTILAKQSQFKVTDLHTVRYLTGNLGFFTVQAIANYQLGNETDVAALTTHLRKLVPSLLSPNISEFEMMNGRAGFLASLLELRYSFCSDLNILPWNIWHLVSYCQSFSTHFGQNLLSDSEIRQVLAHMVNSGRKYSKTKGSSAKLMYEWHKNEYLGAAHGVSGIYQMMLSFWDLLDESAKSDLKQSIDWLMGTQFPSGNFPSSSKRIGVKDELVQWCHGAPGVLQMLIVAHLVLKNDKYLKSAEECAKLIWARGILKKGPGICHGLAGNGYAFLLLYRLTYNEQYLSMAKAFAFIMMTPSFETSARTPDRPWSLFEGWSGALCFLVDLLEPTTAQFPLIPIRFN